LDWAGGESNPKSKIQNPELNMPRITQADLQSYLDESLPPEEMSAVEAELRKRPELLSQLAAINGRRDAGLHSVGEIWRRQRLSCPARQQLGSHLLGALDEGQAAYIEFHLTTIGCRYCQANLEDLRRQQQETAETVKTRRTKYFQSTAGHLRSKR
jgi:anti-sigma factor RsiW